MLSAEEVKDRLSVDDITNLLCKEFGSPEPLMDQNGNYIFSTCACHDGDSMKLWYYPESKAFMCFTHCGSMDIFGLVQNKLHLDNFQEAFRWVVGYFHLEDSKGFSNQVELIDDWDILQQVADYTKYAEKPEEEQKILNENLLEYYDHSSSPWEWQIDGISPKVMQYYGICMDDALSKVIIPHRDIDGHLVGIRGRTFNPLELLKKQKYMPVWIEGTMYNHKLGRNLYGLYENKDNIKRLKKVCIFEAEKSVLQCATMYGIENCWAVAACGSSLSQDQIDLLLSLEVEEIILAFDADHVGARGELDAIEYEQKLIGIVEPFLPYVNVSLIFDYDHILPHKASPSDCGKEKFEILYHQRKMILPPIERQKKIKYIKK